jgi:hypothetical protein
MRNCLPVVVAALLVASPAIAQSSASPKSLKSTFKSTSSDKTLPMKSERSRNSCAAYGPGFVKVEGSDTCVQIGGSISIGAGGAIGGRR